VIYGLVYSLAVALSGVPPWRRLPAGARHDLGSECPELDVAVL
jgi:hypothetical protein